MIGGIALLGTVTATLASWIVQRVAAEDEANQAETRRQVDALTEQLRAQQEVPHRATVSRNGRGDAAPPPSSLHPWATAGRRERPAPARSRPDRPGDPQRASRPTQVTELPSTDGAATGGLASLAAVAVLLIIAAALGGRALSRRSCRRAGPAAPAAG